MSQHWVQLGTREPMGIYRAHLCCHLSAHLSPHDTHTREDITLSPSPAETGSVESVALPSFP